jgi:hypothetical protein
LTDVDFVCGGPAFRDEDPFSKRVALATAITTCSDPISTAFYSTVAKLRLPGYNKMTCFNCGREDGVEVRKPDDDAVYSFCLPTCKDCFDGNQRSYRLKSPRKRRNNDLADDAGDGDRSG